MQLSMKLKKNHLKSVLEWARLRDTARKTSDYSRADELRIKVEETGWQIKDTASGYQIGKTEIEKRPGIFPGRFNA